MAQYRAHVKVGRLVVAGVVFNTQPTLYELSSGEASRLRRLYGDRLVMDIMEDPEPLETWGLDGWGEPGRNEEPEPETPTDTDPDIVLPDPIPEEPEPVVAVVEDPPADPPANPEPEPEAVAGPSRRSRTKAPEADQE